MYRVLLKIDKVYIRIREIVELEVYIKKGKHLLVHSKGQHITNGIALLHNTSQFCLAQSSPNFRIQVYLYFGLLKKLGGYSDITITHFSINSSHRCKLSLLKSPDNNAIIDVDFMYMQTNLVHANLELFSLHEIQQEKINQKLKQYEHNREVLIKEKEKLNQELDRLKEKNILLCQNREQIKKQMNEQSEQYEQKIKNIKQQELYYIQCIQNERNEIQKLESLIEQYEQANKFKKIQQCIHHMHSDRQ